MKRPLIGYQLPAGFPSPADDFIENHLDLNEFLIAHPTATFFIQVEGDSMLGAGINNNDILIVDRALEPQNKKIIIAIINGELTVKRLIIKKGIWYLKAENPTYKSIEINENMDFSVWGVVTYVIHKV